MSTDGRLVQRIVTAQHENNKVVSTGQDRLGFMGHITIISNAITALKGTDNDPIQLYLSADDEETVCMVDLESGSILVDSLVY